MTEPEENEKKNNISEKHGGRHEKLLTCWPKCHLKVIFLLHDSPIFFFLFYIHA